MSEQSEPGPVKAMAVQASTLYQLLRTKIAQDDPRRPMADQAMARIAQGLEAAGAHWDGNGWAGSAKTMGAEVAYVLPEDEVDLGRALLEPIFADPEKRGLQGLLRATYEQLNP